MRTRHPESGADDLVIKVAASVLVLAGVAWGFNKVRDGLDARTEALAEARPKASTVQEPAPVDEPVTQGPSEVVVPPGMQMLRRCSGASGSVYTTDTCPEGTEQVGVRAVPIDRSRGTGLGTGQTQFQRAQRDFARAIGQDQPQPWAPTGFDTPADSRRAECAQVKSLRDEAYRVRGNDRDFDFVRYWQDRVFEACKGT